MNKKLIAVAVASALGAPGVALAQASTVQIYGTLILNYNYLNQGGSKLNTDMFNAHDTNLGFKGEENLGGGLSAWFQCESTMDVSGSSATAQTISTTSGQVLTTGGANWCGRNSAFGLKGAFGNIFAGIWDTAAKTAMGGFRPFSTSGAFGMGAMLWNSAATAGNPATTTAGGITTVTGNASSFTRRQTNSWQYQSPVFSGVQLGATYSAANETTLQTNTTTAAKARLWSVGANYTNGPLAIGAGFERHTNYNPGAQTSYTGGDDDGLSIGAAYTFMGKYKISAIHTQMKYGLAAGAELKQQSWGVYGDLALGGPHKVRLGYTKANSTSGTASGITIGSFNGNAGAGNTGGTHYALQYAYALSKRSEINVGFARQNNDSLAKYSLQSLGGATIGQPQSAWQLGVKHTF